MAQTGGATTQAPMAVDGAAGVLIKDTTTATFSADVLTESQRQPVLVDFWAPWCEPCKQLTPVLEKVVKAAGGKVKLVKMNIDEHPQIAGRLGVRSIPAVFAFQRGQPVDGFMGALPESQVKSFIERIAGALGGGNEEALAEAEAALAEGDLQGAVEIYTSLLDEDPADLAAAAGLAKVHLAVGDIETAKAVLAALPSGAERDAGIIAVKAAIELAEQAASVGDDADLTRRVEADPKDYQARFDLAVALNAKGQRDAATDQLIAIMKGDRTWNEDGARKQLLQFFEAWGLMDAATLSARRKLSSLIFS